MGELIFFYIFIKWRGGNKMTYCENIKNPEGSRIKRKLDGVSDEPRHLLLGGGRFDQLTNYCY